MLMECIELRYRHRVDLHARIGDVMDASKGPVAEGKIKHFAGLRYRIPGDAGTHLQ